MNEHKSNTWSNQNYTRVNRNLLSFKRNRFFEGSGSTIQMTNDNTIKAISKQSAYAVCFYALDRFIDTSKTYTISFDFRCGWEGERTPLAVCSTNATNYSINLGLTPTKANVWEHTSLSFKFSASSYNQSVGLYIGTVRSSLWGPEDASKRDPNIDWVEIKNLKMEEGSKETMYVPCQEDTLDYLKPNLVNGTSSDWSSWITPTYGLNNTITRIASNIYLPDYGRYDITIDLEFDGVSVSNTSPYNQLQTKYDDNGYARYDGCEVNLSDGIKTYTFEIFVNRTGPVKLLEYFGLRTDYWASGRFRFRNLMIKPHGIPNPIWCPSEIDIANPNLIDYVQLNDGNGGRNGDYSETTVIDAPSPYITTGRRVHTYYDIIGNAGWHFGTSEKITIANYGVGYTFTASVYYRTYKQNVTLFVWSVDLGIYKSATYTETGTLWTKATLTFSIPSNLTSDLSVHFIVGRSSGDDSYTEICGWKIEEGDKATAYVDYVSTNNLLTNTNEGLVVKALNQNLEEYTFESDLSIPKVRAVSMTDIAQVVELEDAPFVSKGIEVIATTKNIELNKEVHVEKASTFSLYAKGKGKFSMYMIPEEKELEGITFASYKVGDEFEATDEWQLYEIHDSNLSDFMINLSVEKGSDIKFCAFKLEEGINATDWVDWQEPIDENEFKSNNIMI